MTRQILLVPVLFGLSLCLFMCGGDSHTPCKEDSDCSTLLTEICLYGFCGTGGPIFDEALDAGVDASSP